MGIFQFNTQDTHNIMRQAKVYITFRKKYHSLPKVSKLNCGGLYNVFNINQKKFNFKQRYN